MSSSRTLSWLIGVGILAAGCGPSTPEPAVPDKGGTPVAAPSGTAVASTCAEGKGECDGNAATACETDLAGSAQHCGACGNACAAGQSCSAGACRAGQSISASGANACVVISGHVVCWGDNSANLLASGSKGPKATPVKIAGIEQATLVRTGRRVGCAVTSEGKVACFHDGAFLRHAFDGYASVRALPPDHVARFWLHLLRNMLFKAVIRVGAGYFDQGSGFFLIGAGADGTSLKTHTLARLDAALAGLREQRDPFAL